MNNIALEVESISKQYRLGEVGTGTLSHDLNRVWARLRGKEDPFLKIGEANDRTIKGDSDYVWALKDINFQIEQGDAVGIIGRNGAGKSTLLKLLSKVTAPTTGKIKVKGRIASLLEVGTGFHPEMTGRENIFLNGAILGMTNKEVKRKFDEIVDFAGVERYIDTPVKRYSSGMYVRLAFAVAAYLESEILVVDEVLAVGDAEFQKKCLGKMGDVSRGEGRTVLFVSHNMGSIRKLCNQGILLSNGSLELIGAIENVVNSYIKSNSDPTKRSISFLLDKAKPICIVNISIEVAGKSQNEILDIKDNIKIVIEYIVNENIQGSNISLSLNKEGDIIFRSWDIDCSPTFFEMRKKGHYYTEVPLPNYLMPGGYSLNVSCGRPGAGSIQRLEDCLMFEIENTDTDGTFKSFSRGGLIRSGIKWDTRLSRDVF